MNINVHLGEDDLDRIANQVAAAIREELRLQPARWFDIRAAATHLGMTEDAIRALVKRARIPFTAQAAAASDSTGASSTPGSAATNDIALALVDHERHMLPSSDNKAPATLKTSGGASTRR